MHGFKKRWMSLCQVYFESNAAMWYNIPDVSFCLQPWFIKHS